MKRKMSFDFFVTIIGAIYVIFAIFPLIKSIFSRDYTPSTKKEEWVEEPLLIE